MPTATRALRAPRRACAVAKSIITGVADGDIIPTIITTHIPNRNASSASDHDAGIGMGVDLGMPAIASTGIVRESRTR